MRTETQQNITPDGVEKNTQNTLVKLHSNVTNKLEQVNKEISIILEWKVVDITMFRELKETKSRLTNLLVNPFAEFWFKSLEILKMWDLNIEEWKYIELWQKFWVDLMKMWKAIKTDRLETINWEKNKYNQVISMLKPFWLWKNLLKNIKWINSWASDQYYYWNVVNA